MSALSDCVDQIQIEAGGLLDLVIVLKRDIPDVFEDAAAGDPDAHRLLGAIEHTLKIINAATRRHPKLCTSCPRPLRHGKYSFAVAMPACDSPTQGLALAVCSKCAIHRDDIRAKALIGLQRIWPDGRLVTVTHSAEGKA